MKELEAIEAADLRRALLRNRVPPVVIGEKVVFIIRTASCDLLVPVQGPAQIVVVPSAIERSGWGGTHVAARIARRSPSTIRRWCDDGLIPPAHWRHVAAGRHREIDLEFVRHLVVVLQGDEAAEGV